MSLFFAFDQSYNIIEIGYAWHTKRDSEKEKVKSSYAVHGKCYNSEEKRKHRKRKLHGLECLRSQCGNCIPFLKSFKLKGHS